MYGLSVRRYRADNGRFMDKTWKDDCNTQWQALTFCRVGAHHQNGIAKKRIWDLCKGVRTSLLHAMQQWSEIVSLNLWPFALKNKCEIANTIKLKNGVSAEETFAKVNHKVKLNHYHPFGCPVFVLEALLQSGIGKIPKWDP